MGAIFGSGFVAVYLLVIIAVVVMVLWLMILSITFLRLRIAELKAAKAARTGPVEHS